MLGLHHGVVSLRPTKHTPGRAVAHQQAVEASVLPRTERPRVRGKFLYVGNEKFYVRGVTYGAFRPNEEGREFHDLAQIDRDFEQMARNGLNAVRIPHTLPPVALLNIAQRHGLKVMVGLSAEQYVGYLIDRRKDAPDVEALVRAKVREVRGHPALLCYAIGNEIPAQLVRYLGARTAERYLERVYRAVKAEDPDGIVTYVNYPTTEYLQLGFLDLVCFNVYLESPEPFAAYLARLHTLAGDRPLLMSEIGLDSLRRGRDVQAAVLEWQVRATFAHGCAGLFVFSWTDEWFRAGADVDDWAFGLTDALRTPKPALHAVERAVADVPFESDRKWPRVSVVVCSYNGAATIRDTFEGLRRLEYPDYEVIVVDDGSTDATPVIAGEYSFRVISTPNRGLSAARNTGAEAATGEIVAYIDDDAYPDPHWLQYLVATFQSTEHVGVGGPNIAPPDDGPIATCVANAPGGPIHVLLSDSLAEHIPGCNMAFRRPALLAVGGFDTRFRVAGDDVDVCWQLQQRGWTLGYSPAAAVWHHRRTSLRRYWKQQMGYGRAEALLEQKWPEKYNPIGHVTWSGRMYGPGSIGIFGLGRSRIYQGRWGMAPFQSLYQPASQPVGSLPLAPEWFMLVGGLAALTALGFAWPPLLFVLPLLTLAILLSAIQAARGGLQAVFPDARRNQFGRARLRALTAVLYLLQPLARLRGRMGFGLTPWRRRGCLDWAAPRPCATSVLTRTYRESFDRLERLSGHLRSTGAVVSPGGNYDGWDLEIRGGLLASARVLMACEEYGAEWQLVRLRAWPRWSVGGLLMTTLFGVLAFGAAQDRAWIAAAVLGATALLVGLRLVQEAAAAMAAFQSAARRTE